MNPVIPFWLIVPAAGSSLRMGGDLPKQYRMLAGRPVLQRTLEIFLPIPGLQGVVVALHERDQWFEQLDIAQHPLVTTVIGGAERCDSVLNALDHLSSSACRASNNDWVLIHDAARPCVQQGEVEHMLRALSASACGGIMALPVSDTIKFVHDQGIDHTVDRRALWQAQTPQMFRVGDLQQALQQARQHSVSVTDEASAMERLGHRPQVFIGKRSNLKITHPDDWAFARAILNDPTGLQEEIMAMPRVGHGYDVHRFAEASADAFVVVGGVKIPHSRTLIAHSDGDVLIHALCDALLGAAALGDIGQHFPDTDNRYQNIDSRMLLRNVVALLTEKGLAIGNVDVTVVAQAPKMLPHVSAMCANLASDLKLDVTQVSVKATTTEKLGFEGREEGIACHALALLYPSAD